MSEGLSTHLIRWLLTLGSSPKARNASGLSKFCTVLMMSLHFLGVSSTFPARNRQQEPITWYQQKTSGTNSKHTLIWTLQLWKGKKKHMQINTRKNERYDDKLCFEHPAHLMNGLIFKSWMNSTEHQPSKIKAPLLPHTAVNKQSHTPMHASEINHW